jgi:hypothetical protein
MFLLEPNGWSPVVQARVIRTRGFKTTAWTTDEVTGERHLCGNEHVRFPSVWSRIARRCGFELESQEHVVPFRTPLAKALENAPVLRAIAATHVTSVYRRR